MTASGDPRDRYDGVILGTGHNALVLQGYLARAGLSTIAIDRAAVPGGGLATIENPRAPGFLHNTHAFFLRAIGGMPWFRDLELERHGARMIEPELNVAMVLPDGRALEWWTDIERTVESFAAFSAADARALRRWHDEFRAVTEEVVVPESRSPPLEPRRRRELLERSAAGRRFLEVSALSPLEFVLREFESDAVRAGLLFFNGLREVDLRLRGFGHAIPALLASRGKAQMCAGGSFQLAHALIADIEEHGGEVRCGCPVASILVEEGRAIGVRLESGEEIRAAAFVASGLNPQQTFLDLLPPDAVALDVRRRAEGFRYNLIAPLFTLDLALREPPRYRASATHPELSRAFMVILGLESVEQFHAMVRAHERGEAPPLVAWGATPTLFDPSQAPPGHHTSFLWQKVPYALGGDAGSWERAQRAHEESLLEMWSRHAPNVRDGNIVDRFSRTPLDIERTLPNMRRGDLLVGSFDHGQIGYNRPFAGAGTYRTPIRGLYLCGGSTHPGGNVTGLCGASAASVIAADLGLEAPWTAVST